MAEKSNARLYCDECGSEHYFTRADGRMECTDCGQVAIVLEVFAPFFPPSAPIPDGRAVETAADKGA